MLSCCSSVCPGICIQLVLINSTKKYLVENITWWSHWLNTSFQICNGPINPPESFNSKMPNDWPQWYRHFKQLRIASGIAKVGNKTDKHIALLPGLGGRVCPVLH